MTGTLKIGIVCYPTIGGSGIIATELGFLLADAGHDVHFISYERPVRLNTDRPNLHFHPVIVNEYPLFKYPDYTLPLSVRISEISQQFDLNVLHVHYAVPHATAALLARQMLGGRRRPVIITTLHGTDTNLIGKDPFYRPIIKHSIESSDGVTTVSENLRQQTIEVFQIDHPVEVIPNFFDPAPPQKAREAVRAELGVNEDEILLLHMSNVRPVKRVGDILEAIAQLRNLNKTKLLILAGGDFSPWRSDVESLGLSGRVMIMENVPEIGDYPNACDVGVYASEQESFGLGILETLAYGKPVVATHAGGIPEVVTHTKTGLLVPVGQPSQLAESIDQLIVNADLRVSLGSAAKKDAAMRFNGKNVCAQYMSLYEACLSRG
ncbi:MAG TPA: N-acetyl-alpha-D-glucosaminyl L-malate synthase BshA [Kiritimatiellia bacterium]|mgnify:CR=1 FL=1|nr:N-acetyl-alpha-D-glucosaminyl L-malate synthase BshA [Kiritimatiellia bacterium]